jgi:hypothetical protein
VPRGQRRETMRCSVVIARMSSGRSITWRRSVPVTGAPDRPFPHPAQRPGSWVATASGRLVISRVAPGWPFGRPGFRPLLVRSDLGAGLAGPSDDGGLEEFRGFWPSRARRPATSAASAVTWARSASSRAWWEARSAAISVSLASITCRSRALAARSAANSSGAGGTSGTNHT